MGLTDEIEAVLWINPIQGIITSPGGLRYNPVTRRREFHDGIDIGAPIGTPVVAPRDGTVLAIGYSSTWGQFLRLAHSDGYISFMAHLHRVTVSIGDDVSQGQQVAYSGNTGRSTGPHLHFGLFRDGQYVDPYNYVDLPVSGNLIPPLT
ncbi:MAG: M23 family metallopeptidase [Defluviitaleaceae bacterium]|nr:M23 family metallopeptidase [Defluviitaleaceae bacterium]